MTIRRVLMWYLGVLAFVAATGASGYRALELLHAQNAPPQEAQALPAAPPVTVVAEAEPPATDAVPPPIALPALRPPVAAAAPARIAQATVHTARRSSSGTKLAAHRTLRHAPYAEPHQQVVAYAPPAPGTPYYAYPRYYVYGPGYGYYVAYPRYPRYPGY
jgi:hypothetical protein